MGAPRGSADKRPAVHLGGLEQRVLAVLWDDETAELTVRDVSAHFPDHAYTTVMTVLDRLERKGMLRRRRDGRAHRYSPTASREEYAAALMMEALGTSADRGAALVHFAGSVGPDEAALLRDILNGAAVGPAPRQPDDRDLVRPRSTT